MRTSSLIPKPLYLLLGGVVLFACGLLESFSWEPAIPQPIILTSAPAIPRTSTVAAPATPPLVTPRKAQKHIIWDDDGSPDGVIALLYFLQHPEISVDAITVSCGEAHPNIFAANLTQMLARIEQTGIPVAAGRSTPLEGDNTFPDPWRSSTDTFWEIGLPEALEAVQSMSAAELIVGVLNDSTEPVTVFVSGNHTNFAEALRLDPGIADQIEAVQVMGGALYVPGNIQSDWPEIENAVAEWNIWVDPIAAREVFNSGLPVHLTPLDATNQVIWTSDDADAWEATGSPEGMLAAEILRWMLSSWFPEGVYAWDLVAAVNVSDPQYCHQDQLYVEVDTRPGAEEGRTIVVANLPANVTSCFSPQEFMVKQLVTQVFGMP